MNTKYNFKDIKEKANGVPMSSLQQDFLSLKLNLNKWALSSMHWNSLKIDPGIIR